MAPKKQPPPLSLVCVNLLSNQLIQTLSDDEAEHLDQVRTYMSSMTSVAIQHILKNILALINRDAGTRYNCLKVLLRQDVQRLEIGIFPRFYYEKILITIREQGKGLQHLNLKGVWPRDCPSLVNSMILNLPSLKSLHIPHTLDDSVILSLCNLKHLTVLDISGEAGYTPQGIRLLKSDSITYLDIGYFGKPHLCTDCSSGPGLVAEIIQNLPNLNVLKTYSFTGKALNHLCMKNGNVKTKLTYLHDTNTNLDILRVIVETCPYLESILINQPQEGVAPKLAELERLHTLKLVKGNGSDLRPFIQSSVRKLQFLRINSFKNSTLDLAELCEHAPDLIKLEFYRMSLRFFNPNAFFLNLENIQMLDCDITDDLVRTIFTNVPSLKTFNVGCSIGLTDGDMLRLLAECSLDNLEELFISEARGLTRVTVQLLLENCPRLTLLGSISGWDVSQEEQDEFKDTAASTNLDLTLWPLI